MNTQLESVGAEFLVLGSLLIEGISAFKTYQNFKGYDIVAVNPENNTSAKIQVKSRYQTGWNGFLIKDFNSDFVVLVALNRGYPKPKKNGDTGIKAPIFYIFPTDYIKSIDPTKGGWGKIPKAKLIDLESYINRWDYIRDFLDNSNHLKS